MIRKILNIQLLMFQYRAALGVTIIVMILPSRWGPGNELVKFILPKVS